MQDTTLLFTLTDSDGIQSREPVRLSLVAVPDMPPQVAVRLLRHRHGDHAAGPAARLGAALPTTMASPGCGSSMRWTGKRPAVAEEVALPRHPTDGR